MPQITFKGMKIKEVCEISTILKDKLQEILDCDRKHLKFDYVESVNIDNGAVIDSFPKIEMLWLPKEQEIQDKAAIVITDMVKKIGYEHVQVSFKVVPGERFYENGQQY
jgi:hypothetical protein